MNLKKTAEQFRVIMVSYIILSLFILTRCGGTSGGESDTGVVFDQINTSYAKTIKGDEDVDITEFNGSTIFAIIAFMPSNKRESDSAPATSSDWTLYSTVDLTPSTVYSDSNLLSLSKKNYSGTKVFSSKQTEWDIKMRDSENKFLARKVLQFSKKSAGRFSAAPSSISEGTSWDDVTIAITGNTIDTVCQYVSTYACIFVDIRDTADSDLTDEKLTAFGTAFDTIYVKNHEKFGTENDVDDNNKVIIVFSREITEGYLGYFYDADKFAYNASTNPDSNEGDIFYMTADTYSESVICGTLAHEFQHMIYFDEHYNRGVDTTYAWLNEALSQAAEYYNGYLENHEGWIESFLSGGWYGLSLTNWTDANYGYGAIFIRYLIDQYGDAAIKKMCSTKKIGVAAVESATGEDFNTIFYNFILALAISGTGDTSDSRYNFTTLDLQSVQSAGRGGLIPYTSALSAGHGVSSYNYPYEIFFIKGTGSFETMTLSGSEMFGAALGLNQ